MYDIFHKYGFDKIDDNASLDKTLNESLEMDYEEDRPYDLGPEWQFRASKTVKDDSGFTSEYTWWYNPETGIHKFFFDGVEDWEAESESTAQEWFDSYTGFEDDIEDTYHGFFGEDEILTESYDNLPSWFTTWLDSKQGSSSKSELNKNGIDLHNATYIKGQLPKNAYDPQLRDASKLPIFRITDEMRNEHIYIPGVNNPYLFIQGDFKAASSYAKRDLLSVVNDFGYIDLNDPRNKNLATRRERADRKYHGVNRGIGQHPVKTNVQYGYDEDGRIDFNKVIGYDIKWVTNRGEDKSGYPLDPTKYERMLNDVGLDGYADRLDMYYKQLESIRSRITNVITKLSIDDSTKYISQSWENNLFSDIGDATRSLASAIDTYQKLKSNIDDCLNRYNSDEVRDENIRYCFRYDGKMIRDYIAKASNYIKIAENPRLKQN